ncbi:MAG TPA: bifunctional diaminohydroxyphosphoribosylaminopyrimidine deaminase/5-amino-6-(5-phosphoribosylamino)uracil reductase RibD [Bdellovibrionota bacterium]|nr:bifunctional diaminohydroxyphosphoribosylaminopyrimidine deaminase/5-amino-6-(5-phosphoribosylamino)uracil reductase RibD [Bdellovibrionota bacterium]
MKISEAMDLAVERAREHVGATSPNPPVGAVALDSSGALLATGAHVKAGLGHAEARLLAELREKGILARAHSVVVTLEPCNHQGRTPPCSEALLAAGIRRVVYACKDPNPRVAGDGAGHLRRAGLEVEELAHEGASRLIQPFTRWVTSGRPWVVVKTALDAEGSMIPPPGMKTFTSEASLELAHRLRRESDAIITGSGTILADQPEFTVRRVPDHPGKRRWLMLLDRRGRVPESYLALARSRGFEPRRAVSPEEALDFLGSQGCLQALVEAGPLVTEAFVAGCLWDRRVVIKRGSTGQEDSVEELERLP